jgi:hypothetical protein
VDEATAGVAAQMVLDPPTTALALVALPNPLDVRHQRPIVTAALLKSTMVVKAAAHFMTT